MPKGGRGPACPGGRREGKVQYSGVGAGKMACPCGPTAGAAQPTVGTASGTEATGEESTVRGRLSVLRLLSVSAVTEHPGFQPGRRGLTQ